MVGWGARGRAAAAAGGCVRAHGVRAPCQPLSCICMRTCMHAWLARTHRRHARTHAHAPPAACLRGCTRCRVCMHACMHECARNPATKSISPKPPQGAWQQQQLRTNGAPTSPSLTRFLSTSPQQQHKPSERSKQQVWGAVVGPARCAARLGCVSPPTGMCVHLDSLALSLTAPTVLPPTHTPLQPRSCTTP